MQVANLEVVWLYQLIGRFIATQKECQTTEPEGPSTYSGGESSVIPEAVSTYGASFSAAIIIFHLNT